MVKAVLANEDGFILTKWYVNNVPKDLVEDLYIHVLY